MNFSRYAKPYMRMTDNAVWQANARTIAKQLPPSAAQLRLLDLGCGPGSTLRDLQTLRPDIAAIGLDPAWGMLHLAQARTAGHFLAGSALRIPLQDNSVDAVISQRVYYFLGDTQPRFLAEAMRVLRPGGRLILVDPIADKAPLGAWRELRHGFFSAVDMFAWHLAASRIGGFTPQSMAEHLQKAGFARILTETVLEGWGIMGRGEKPYAAGTSTLERVVIGAGDDKLPGRYIHVLVHQKPDKPTWALTDKDVVTWGAAAIPNPQGEPILLAFSSLPKAVAFMQEAVMDGSIHDINKVGKFSKDVAQTWDFPFMLNPTLDDIRSELPATLISLDPATAEAPDE